MAQSVREKVRKQREKRDQRRYDGTCTACGKPVAWTEDGRWLEGEGRFERRLFRMCRRHLNQLASQQRRFHQAKD